MLIRLFTAGLIIGALSGSATAQSAVTPYSSHVADDKKLGPTKEVCKAFVQEFYAWYLPKARDWVNANPLGLALKERRSAFSARISEGLKEVDAQAARNQDPGLDFDPILNTQDSGNPGDPGYSVTDGKVEHGVCHIEVFRPRYGGGFEKAVAPELRFDKGRWFFVNFHYPNSPSPEWENLLSAMKAYLTFSAEAQKKPH